MPDLYYGVLLCQARAPALTNPQRRFMAFLLKWKEHIGIIFQYFKDITKI